MLYRDVASNDHQPYTGPERRRVVRPPRIAPRVMGRSRVASGYARLALGLDPEEWYQVVNQHPETRPPEASAGYVWPDLGTRPRSCRAAHLEPELEPSR
jgi:hypothetical protein